MPLLTTRAGASAGAYGFGAAATERTSYVLLASATITSGTVYTITNIPSGYFAYSLIGDGSHYGTGGADLDIRPKDSSGTDFNVYAKGMHAQGWSWNMSAQSAAALAERSNNTGEHFIEDIWYGTGSSAVNTGRWFEGTWGGSGSNYWKFGGGWAYRPSSSGMNRIEISLYSYPSTPSFREASFKVYGIKES